MSRGRPPARRGVITPAEFEIHYDRMVCALIAAVRRDPSVASRWKAATVTGRMEIIEEALRGRIGSRGSREPSSGLCVVCRQLTAADDPVFVVGNLVVAACADCVKRARDKARSN